MKSFWFWFVASILLFGGILAVWFWWQNFSSPAKRFAYALLRVSRSEEVSEPWDVYPQMAEEMPDAVIPEILTTIGRWRNKEARSLARHEPLSRLRASDVNDRARGSWPAD